MLVFKPLFTLFKSALFHFACKKLYNVGPGIGSTMEQRTLKNVNNDLNKNIYSYLETSGGQSYNLYLKTVHFFTTSVN